MGVTVQRLVDSPHPVRRIKGFIDWRGRVDRERIAPVVAIAGTRGKTSLLRLVEAILCAGGLRIAAWTDSGVEIEGERQRGELGPWSRALTRLKTGGLDVALQELDWNTVPVLSSPGEAYPVVAVANFCANNEACLVTPDMLQARRALGRLRNGVAPSGRLVLNADDFAVADEERGGMANRLLVGVSADTPVLRRHISRGGDAVWIEDGQIVIQEELTRSFVCPLRSLPWTRGGRIPFAAQNALLATAIARSMGLPNGLVSSALAAYDAAPDRVPGAFNVFAVGAGTVVVDSPVPSWFLRTTLRGLSGVGDGRQIRVAGPMSSVESHDLGEVGRLLGRAGGVLVLHGSWPADRLAAIRHGASANGVPPLIIQLADERSAVQQCIEMLRQGDVMLVLAENPSSVIRQVEKQARRHSTAARGTPGAA